MRCLSVPTGRSYIISSSAAKVNATSGYTSAMCWKVVMRLRSSVWSDFRNRRLAGTLKNRFCTCMLVPTGHWHGSCFCTCEPAISSSVPTSSDSRRVVILTCATAHMLGSASPRNPIVRRWNKSCASRIFDVAWRSNAIRASEVDIPEPSSITCTSVLPASRTSTRMVRAPASSEFSTNSFRHDAGR